MMEIAKITLYDDSIQLLEHWAPSGVQSSFDEAASRFELG